MNKDNGWISVKDKLPTPFEYVLIFWETETEKMRYDVAFWNEHHNTWHCTEFAIMLNIRPEQVSHWQPLPAKPED